jgi:hypothetical protein
MNVETAEICELAPEFTEPLDISDISPKQYAPKERPEPPSPIAFRRSVSPLAFLLLATARLLSKVRS